jgi:hypothetical protein
VAGNVRRSTGPRKITRTNARRSRDKHCSKLPRASDLIGRLSPSSGYLWLEISCIRPECLSLLFCLSYNDITRVAKWSGYFYFVRETQLVSCLAWDSANDASSCSLFVPNCNNSLRIIHPGFFPSSKQSRSSNSIDLYTYCTVTAVIYLMDEHDKKRRRGNSCLSLWARDTQQASISFLYLFALVL